MLSSLRAMPRLLCAASALLIAGRVLAADVYQVRFDPPRMYFMHASINKGGPAAGIKGQDNFLSLYMPAVAQQLTPVDNTKGQYAPDRFSLSLLLPAYLEMLDQQEQGLTVTPTQLDGRPYQQVTMRLDPVVVKARCFVGDWGVNPVLWYRVKAGAAIPAEPQEIRLTLLHGDQTCFTDTAKLRLYEALSPGPRVSPRHFRLWLHYGPHVRRGHWDELAQYLNLAGINAIQFTVGGPEALEDVRQMRRRGFYIIIQRGASYEEIYKDNMRACLEQGPAWFEKADQGSMTTYLPEADAVLWDYEPSPLPTGLDDWLIAQFRQSQKLPPDELLNEDTIRSKYLRPYLDFRQTQLATCIKHWADYCRSVNPKIETILTEGGVLAYDPTRQVDYAKYQDYVTFCDPMNFTGVAALHVVQQYMQHAPRARFTGCQNVSLSAYHSVFISPQTIMLQTLSAALIGQHGTAVYPGQALDADNFVLWSRVMGFLGRHEKLMFEGRRDPANVKLALLPKEEQEVTLGDGRKLRNTYPDWDHDAIQRSYAAADGSEFLVVLANWHAREPCYGKLTVTLPKGSWLLADDENRQLFTQRKRPQLDAALLAQGVFVQCPAGDYRGIRLVRYSPAALQTLKGYQPVPLEETAQAARAYTQAAAAAGGATATGDQKLTFDDLDHDGKFEYLVQSSKQKVWVSQNGTVLRWTIGDQTLDTEGLGLCRDMLWLPQGERENRGMDMVMRLESKQVRPEGVTLTFSKDVPLSTVGGAGIRLVKELAFSNTPGDLAVKVRLANTSVAPEATKLTCSYRVHHYLKYGAAGNIFWAYDGATVRQWDQVESHYTVPNTGLTPADANQLFTQNDVTAPLSPLSFGEYAPDQRLLFQATPAQPERILQLLRWGRTKGMAGSGTVEWMYRPETLAVGHDLTYEYRLNLRPGVAALNAASVQPQAAAPAAGADAHLLLHLNFDGTPDAATAGGDGTATVTGTPTYEDTPGGKGIVVTKGVQLSYLPAGNIDLSRGHIAIRFKPLWEGADGKTHFLFTVRPRAGFVYLGKLADGRFLMNMFDPADKQHYPAQMIQTLRAGTWHEAVVTWDTTRGTMLLIFDGQKAAEVRDEPWQMAPLDNALAYCRLAIPADAEAVIDDVKVWDQP